MTWSQGTVQFIIPYNPAYGDSTVEMKCVNPFHFLLFHTVPAFAVLDQW